jgi:hypothetical protein
MRYLNELVAAVQREQADIGLATDRTRIASARLMRWETSSTHHVFALVLRHGREPGQRGDVVKTLSTTTMIDARRNAG